MKSLKLLVHTKNRNFAVKIYFHFYNYIIACKNLSQAFMSFKHYNCFTVNTVIQRLTHKQLNYRKKMSNHSPPPLKYYPRDVGLYCDPPICVKKTSHP